MSYIGQEPTTVAFLTNTFNGDGTTVAFTMSVAPATTTSILVAITGVVQDPSTYSVVGTTLTFSAAPPSGTGNISVRYLGIPASGVTTTAYRTQTEFTATAGQTTFSVPSYTVGYIDVYRNGLLLGSSDFTATNGTTVVLAAAASAGDFIETVSFFVSSVVNAIANSAGAVQTSNIADSAITTAKIAAGAVVQADMANSSVGTAQLIDANVTPTKLSQPLTSGTAVASTSGTIINYTSIPSWVRRITVMFANVSTNGSSTVIVRLGSGSIQTTGYDSTASCGTAAGAYQSSTAGFLASYQGTNSNSQLKGALTFTLLGSNIWIQSGCVGDTVFSQTTSACSGSVTLGGVLDRLAITTLNGTDAFDAGSVNILYE